MYMWGYIQVFPVLSKEKKKKEYSTNICKDIEFKSHLQGGDIVDCSQQQDFGLVISASADHLYMYINKCRDIVDCSYQ